MRASPDARASFTFLCGQVRRSASSNREAAVPGLEHTNSTTPEAFLAAVFLDDHDQRRGELAISAAPKPCNCKRSRCLKKYCKCFARNAPCVDGCKCVDCHNTDQYRAHDASASASTIDVSVDATEQDHLSLGGLLVNQSAASLAPNTRSLQNECAITCLSQHMADNFTEEQVAKQKVAFASFDKDGDGTVGAECLLTTQSATSLRCLLRAPERAGTVIQPKCSSMPTEVEDLQQYLGWSNPLTDTPLITPQPQPNGSQLKTQPNTVNGRYPAALPPDRSFAPAAKQNTSPVAPPIADAPWVSSATIPTWFCGAACRRPTKSSHVHSAAWPVQTSCWKRAKSANGNVSWVDFQPRSAPHSNGTAIVLAHPPGDCRVVRKAKTPSKRWNKGCDLVPQTVDLRLTCVKAYDGNHPAKDYMCGYCNRIKTSNSRNSDHRVRIRCECGGQYQDNRLRMHATWSVVPSSPPPANETPSLNDEWR